ncbi:hypothetical protein F183_A28860 [Bryobacterales bacterium F-183]|nr:hypothetical protein F183_A28860 [Bryobacterales bacterium F-183]
MTGLLLCLCAFVMSYLAGRHSLVRGLAAVCGVGYVYGIARAWVYSTPAYFLFDAALIGLYLAQLFPRSPVPGTATMRQLKIWIGLLVLWPLLLLFVPVQPYLVQLVGLRCAVFFLMCVLLGARLAGEDLYEFALWLAGLNLIALVAGAAEFTMGIERFIPVNDVTAIMYASKDVGEGMAHRIPSIFSSAHAYGGTMVATVPFLVGAWLQPRRPLLQRALIVAGLLAAILGVLISAARMHFVILAALLLVLNISLKMRAVHRFTLLAAMALLGFLVSQQERMQRFTSLSKVEEVSDRVRFSLSSDFWTLAQELPMGNGLGGGGTNMPYFLAGQIRNRLIIENEYARILLEEGWVGLLLWLAFIVWIFTRRSRGCDPNWIAGRRMAWVLAFLSNATAFIGNGLLVSIPQSVIMLVTLGWIVSGGPYSISGRKGQVSHAC